MAASNATPEEQRLEAIEQAVREQHPYLNPDHISIKKVDENRYEAILTVSGVEEVKRMFAFQKDEDD